jgi:hypothetical protein
VRVTNAYYFLSLRTLRLHCTAQSPGTTLDRAADEAAKALKHIGALQGGSVGGLAGGTPITVDSSKVVHN